MPWTAELTWNVCTSTCARCGAAPRRRSPPCSSRDGDRLPAGWLCATLRVLGDIALQRRQFMRRGRQQGCCGLCETGSANSNEQLPALVQCISVCTTVVWLYLKSCQVLSSLQQHCWCLPSASAAVSAVPYDISSRSQWRCRSITTVKSRCPSVGLENRAQCSVLQSQLFAVRLPWRPPWHRNTSGGHDQLTHIVHACCMPSRAGACDTR